MIRLHTLKKSATIGRISLDSTNSRQFFCAIGRTGISAFKREGDGKTPAGSFLAEKILYRPDRVLRPNAHLPILPIRQEDGWCDAPGDKNYNRQITLPYQQSAEHLKRSDEIYDIIVILNHNRRPRIQGLGSAIFMHIAKPGFTPTEGCLAINKRDMLELLKHLRPTTKIVFGL